MAKKDLASVTGQLLARKREAVQQSWLADVTRAAQPSAEVVKYLGPQGL